MATLKLTKGSRAAYAKSGIALPDGKFPIPDRAHLRAAIAYRHHTSEPYARVAAHIRKRAGELGVKVNITSAGPPKGAYGRSTSLKWPHLYDILVAKGYDHSKAAAISNSRVSLRKNGRKNVLKASEAHNPKVLARLNAAQKAGKHLTRKQLTASVRLVPGTLAHDFACHSAACAPPPAGTGGSRPGGFKAGAGGTMTIADRRAISHDGIERKLAHLPDANLPSVKGSPHAIITAAEKRGDSRPVSHDEFQALAAEGHRRLAKLAANSSPHTGLDTHWEALKNEAYSAATQSWGGATIDAHTGKVLPQGTNAFALTVKHPGSETISIPENASRAEFNAAMDRAKSTFSGILQRQGHNLGVFHDDENHRIDFDPVLVTSRHSDVETIGAATRAIGGAYNFKDGNGYWPPHVAE